MGVVLRFSNGAVLSTTVTVKHPAKHTFPAKGVHRACCDPGS